MYSKEELTQIAVAISLGESFPDDLKLSEWIYLYLNSSSYDRKKIEPYLMALAETFTDWFGIWLMADNLDFEKRVVDAIMQFPMDFDKLQHLLKTTPHGSKKEEELLKEMVKLARNFDDWLVICVHSSAFSDLKNNALTEMERLAENEDQKKMVKKHTPIAEERLLSSRPY